MKNGSVYLHIGAHRTGTSSLQMCLHVNRDELHRAGFDLAYPGRDGIPSGNLALRLPSPRHRNKDLAKFAEKARNHFANLRTHSDRNIILSEENILGRMFHFYQGRFYPAADIRTQTLKHAIEIDQLARVVLVVRRYDELYVSAHRKRAEDNVVEPFDLIKPRLMSMDRGWPEIVEIVANELRPSELLVVDYSARGSSADLLNLLVPELSDLSLKEPERTMNQSATDAALVELQRLHHSGRKLSRKEWKAVISQYSDEAGDQGFASFDRTEVRELQKKYAQDLTLIKQMHDVKLLA